ncbi:hypothetical protein V6N11_066562 [Hibiscus sabdariffa]|uniref:Uncharacterized protein n=1 Tax=Hibiscus sabdariffa TaxID=183260 RepID=A0ABR2A4I5_9ROSI
MGGLIVRREGLDYCSNKACQTGLSLYGQRHCLLAIASSLPVSSISITIKILTQQMSVGLSYPESLTPVEVFCSHVALVLENS